MNKSIQEIAREYAEYRTKGGAEYDSKTEYHQDRAIYYDEAMAVLPWLFEKPLTERLTEDEKKQIKEEYTDNLTLMYQANISYVQREIFTQRNNLLEDIFGKELFNE